MASGGVCRMLGHANVTNGLTEERLSTSGPAVHDRIARRDMRSHWALNGKNHNDNNNKRSSNNKNNQIKQKKEQKREILGITCEEHNDAILSIRGIKGRSNPRGDPEHRVYVRLMTSGRWLGDEDSKMI
ncbi:unnamed protein product, partial [Nesidiocoris tenuis]